MIDINKQYQTRAGCEARIYCTDGGGDYPVHGAIKNHLLGWVAATWTLNGESMYYKESHKDLIEVLPRIKGWANVYSHVCGSVHPSRESADTIARPDRIACIEIDVPHGHGLETK